MLFHYPAVRLTELQAESMGFKLVQVKGSRDEYASLIELFTRFKKLGADGVVAGALLSDYQRLRFSMAAEEVGLKTYTPLWRKNQEEYMRSLIREGFKFIIVTIQAYGIPEKFLGKVLTEDDIEEIIELSKLYGFNPGFEGGEAETLVIDAPLFRYRLEVEGKLRRIAPYHYVYDIYSARLIPKNAL
jgi:predicted ATP pyrophosphatase (TIGR00289 family)